MALNIQQAIEKFGGEDEAYKNKLKTHIREAMGYSNFISQLKGSVNAPMDVGNIDKLDPNAIARRRESKANIQNTETKSLEQATSQIDSAADALASSQVSREKQEKDKYRYDTSFIYNPTDELDQKILEYAQNPYNEDGSVKSLQQFESELRTQFGASTNAGQSDILADYPVDAAQRNAGKYTNMDIKDRILERIPADYIGKEETYAYRFRGLGEKAATDQLILGYGDMILAGRGDKVPPELYPAAYASLTPVEQSKVRPGSVADFGGLADF